MNAPAAPLHTPLSAKVNLVNLLPMPLYKGHVEDFLGRWFPCRTNEFSSFRARIWIMNAVLILRLNLVPSAI